MPVQNEEMFWCSDDDKMDWLFDFNANKIGNYVSNAWKKPQEVLFVKYYLYVVILVHDFFSFPLFSL